MKTYIIVIATAAVLAPPARSSDAMQTWNDLPEHQTSDWIETCLPSLRWSTAIMSLKTRGATSVQMLRWAETEAEKEAAKDPDPMSLIPFGVQSSLINLILAATAFYGDNEIKAIPGGFPQFAYRSCLKDKPLDK